MDKLTEDTLSSLLSQNIVATPRNYAREFYKLAKESNTNLEDIEDLEFILHNLSDEELNELKDNKIIIATDLLNVTSKRIKKSDTLKFINALAEIIKPSIDQSIYQKIEEVIFDLIKTPEKLVDDSTINKILNITNERVKLDRDTLKDKSEDIKKFITLLVKEYEKSIIISNNSSEKLVDIKSELDGMDFSKHSNREIELLYSKLTKIVFDLETNTESSKFEIMKGRDECNDLQSDIKKLQSDLEKLKKEKDIDFLTGVLNRRGYTNIILQTEKKYSMFNSKYAIVFFDIDDFKDINDSHGHDCGDVVLKTFATILNKMMREADVICRYGGEEFVALISYKNKDEVINYVKRVKDIIVKHKFVYTNEIKLKVRFSAGIAFRDNYNSYEDTIKYADILLYKAKHEGKDKTILDSGEVI